MRLRYTGPQPVVFNHPQAGAVEPAGTFWVDDDDAPAFLTRSDVQIDETAEAEADTTPEESAAARGRKTRKTTDTATGPDGDPTVTPADAQST